MNWIEMQMDSNCLFKEIVLFQVQKKITRVHVKKKINVTKNEFKMVRNTANYYRCRCKQFSKWFKLFLWCFRICSSVVEASHFVEQSRPKFSWKRKQIGFNLEKPGLTYSSKSFITSSTQSITSVLNRYLNSGIVMWYFWENP